jgi:bifunctional polynucleotide phosphatase/kinase
MWVEMLDDYDLDRPGAVNMEESLFVGDAAGRDRDHSCSDRNMASNVGIQFQTPEEFFLGEEAKPFKRTFDPKTYLKEVEGAANDTSRQYDAFQSIT